MNAALLKIRMHTTLWSSFPSPPPSIFYFVSATPTFPLSFSTPLLSTAQFSYVRFPSPQLKLPVNIPKESKTIPTARPFHHQTKQKLMLQPNATTPPTLPYSIHACKALNSNTAIPSIHCAIPKAPCTSCFLTAHRIAKTAPPTPNTPIVTVHTFCARKPSTR